MKGLNKIMKKIIINKKLKFNNDDLMQYVDITKSFTLKDIFSCIENSKVPIKSLMKILKCRYLEEYMEEINKPNVSKSKKKDVKYLEVYRDAGMDEEEKDKEHWAFHGIGKRDEIGCCQYSLDFTPLWEIADLEVKVSNIITTYDMKNKKAIRTKFAPLLMLVELLHTVVWELSWNGSIKNREARLKELKRRVDNLKKEIKSKKKT